MLALAGWAMFGPAAQADVDVPAGRVTLIGIDPRFEGPMVMLEDTTGALWTGSQQYYLSAQLGNAGLATLLTAVALGQNVFVRIAGTAEPGSLITIIFLSAPAS